MSTMPIWTVSVQTRQFNSIMVCDTCDFYVILDWATRVVAEFGPDTWHGQDVRWLFEEASSFVLALGDIIVGVIHQDGLWEWHDDALFNEESGRTLDWAPSGDVRDNVVVLYDYPFQLRVRRKFLQGDELLAMLPTPDHGASARLFELNFEREWD